MTLPAVPPGYTRIIYTCSINKLKYFITLLYISVATHDINSVKQFFTRFFNLFGVIKHANVYSIRVGFHNVKRERERENSSHHKTDEWNMRTLLGNGKLQSK